MRQYSEIPPRKPPKRMMKLASQDGVVIGLVMRHHLRFEEDFEYEASTRRTYQDGVDFHREIFFSMNKAKIWLQFMFDEELAKHFDRLGKKSEKK